MSLPTLSLTDPPTDSPVTEGVAWIQGAALGSTATIVAVVAVATIGMLMLSGRLELRRGITVVLGCFILFGASGIAAALTGLAGENLPQRRPMASDAGQLSSQLQSPTSPPAAYDPYAGASVPTPR
ncbi:MULTISPECIES: TrbC/VirB2 family protein [unclassified Sphingopyxis]|uniref:TrbC/VirB2 family protein n=1 Tax=unclassified Sphingopyxis TaxID=2614943 RepID=UPI00286A7F2A|nr:MULTISPECIES: TrbC/VirB2 family protein [unclassified Sphingopyxis]